IAVVTFVLFPVAIERWRSRGDSSFGAADAPHRAISRRRLWSAAGCLPVLALCWYLAGPPWHLERNHDAVEWHEQMHYGGVQALDKGFLPDIGPAATSYGPGAQLMVYEAMKLAGAFDVESFRTAWAGQQFIGLMIVGTVAYLW